MFRRLLRKFRDSDKEKEEPLTTPAASDETAPSSQSRWPIGGNNQQPTEEADICIVGAGVSGLTAALTACQAMIPSDPKKVVVLEGSPTVGGRVQSDVTADGFVLDRGFAVFIEEYPTARKVLDYDALQLRPFLPGALVKLPDRFRLARVADPLRVPSDLLTALLAPVGGLLDKIKVLPLIYHVKTSTIEDLFKEPETTTQEALGVPRWDFSSAMQQAFFEPFLQGIYLAPLAEQSSRMFSFVFKMLSEGAAHLPTGGMGAVAQQLRDKAVAAGADVRVNQAVAHMEAYAGGDNNDDGYLIVTADGKTRLQTKSLIVATDGAVAQQLLSQLDGFASLETLPPIPQRAVGNLYYSFKGTTPPVTDPILVLNGNPAQRNTKEYPINNICFPSVVNPSYAPEGYSLCSVTVLSDAMEAYQDDDPGLDHAVRLQLGNWFREYRSDIYDGAKWKLQGIYRVHKAQPGQLSGPFPSNRHGGRPANVYRGKELPPGVLVCGDHMATATLNGALESGVLAGQEAAQLVRDNASAPAPAKVFA